MQAGVQGVGQGDSKVALFSAEGGERGVLCVDDIVKGETVFEVPLRLALTDHKNDDETNRLLYEVSFTLASLPAPAAVFSLKVKLYSALQTMHMPVVCLCKRLHSCTYLAHIS